MGKRSICILESCRSERVNTRQGLPGKEASPQGIAPAHPPAGESLLLQKDAIPHQT